MENKKEKVYIPKIKFIYPKQTDSQLIKVNEKRKIKLDEKYYNRLKRATFKIGQFFFYILFVLVAHPLVYMRYHLKIKGKNNLKPYKKQFKKNGFITVSNHVFLWDYVTICTAMKMGFPNVPSWGKVLYSKFGGIFSLAGAVPIAEDTAAFRKFYNFFDGVFKENKWVHIYPETGMWSYYVPIRPFKRGAAVFSYQYDKPIVPIGLSFRERKGIAKWFNKKDPYVTVNICEPIWPDKTLPKREAAEKLTAEIREAIMHAVGIESEEENERLMKEYYQYEDGYFYTNL